MALPNVQCDAVSCASALAHAATDGTPSYFSLLPRAVACIVDKLVALNAWRWTGQLARVSLPPPMPMAGAYEFVRWDSVALTGGEVLIMRRSVSDEVRISCISNLYVVRNFE